MAARALPIIGEGGLSRYLAEIRKFPLLDPQEEYMLAKRWRAGLFSSHSASKDALRVALARRFLQPCYGLALAQAATVTPGGILQLAPPMPRFSANGGYAQSKAR